MIKGFIVASLLGLAAVLSSCTDESKVEPPAVNVEINPAEQPSQISYQTAMNFSSGGLMRAVLHAGRVQTFDAKHYTLLDSSVKVDFYDKLGQHSSRLTSTSAKINNVTNNMTAYGNVHIVSDSGSTVDTDSMVWDNHAQTLHSEARVKIVEKNGRITLGEGFQSDQNLSHYNILRPNIQAPAGSLDEGSSPASPQPTLKPAQPEVPGSGIFHPQPGFALPSAKDSAKK